MVRRKTSQIHPPAGRQNDGNPPALLTVVGSDAKLKGKFDIAASIQIECEVSGELKVGGKLVIGERGSVHADVQTVDAIIHGEYEGKMVATGRVKLAATARVHSNIETNSLVIDKGGFFTGNVLKLKESEDEGGTPSVSAVEERAEPLPPPSLQEAVLPGDPHGDEDPHPGDRPARGGGRPVPQARPKKKGKTSHDHGTMVKLKESKAKRRTPAVCAVDEMAKRPLALWDKGLPGYPPPAGGSEDRPARGGGRAGRDQGSGDTFRGAGAGDAVDKAPGGRAEREGEPEPRGPLAGTPEPRDRVRAGAQMRAKKQRSTSHDRGTMVKLKESKAKRRTPAVSVVEEMTDPLPLPLLQEEMRRGQSPPDGDPHLGDRPGQGDRGAGRDQGSGDSVRGAGAGHGVEEAPGGRAERAGEPEPGGPLVGTPKRWARVQPIPQAGPKGQGNACDDASGDKELGVMDEAVSPPNDDPLGIR